ncbi:hypothetical protein PoB_004889700 [Plakobranchus ocellatus]|uniref:Secreted protein n=1 Tax=Plakobranchus ocellatus TaxID=259542 RepID=A0AAV4BSS2_9GAST|nr:hypothetical protein PoB_004889700 [Plakobranchus ocellatus]
MVILMMIMRRMIMTTRILIMRTKIANRRSSLICSINNYLYQYVSGTVACESALRSVGTLPLQVRDSPPVPESLKSPIVDRLYRIQSSRTEI